MPVAVALTGPPGSGKTTLFNALTAGRGADGVGMIDVPDQRLDQLAAAVNPKRIVPAQVRLIDAPPGSRAQRIASAREADVVLAVIRCFGPDPDPAGDLESIGLDMVLADLATVERRLEIAEKEARSRKPDAGPEVDALRLAKQHLDAGRPLRTLGAEPEVTRRLTPLFPVSIKPVVVVANIDDARLPDGGEPAARLARLAAEQQSETVVVAAALEQEIGELDPADAAEYRSTYGLAESGLGAVARAVWHAGGLITYFTAGEPEVRAWPCEDHAPAPVAAGKIHSDFEQKFIRAEVTSVDDLVGAGSMEALRGAGRLRVEGREYEVRDGDVVFFRVGR